MTYPNFRRFCICHPAQLINWRMLDKIEKSVFPLIITTKKPGTSNTKDSPRQPSRKIAGPQKMKRIRRFAPPPKSVNSSYNTFRRKICPPQKSANSKYGRLINIWRNSNYWGPPHDRPAACVLLPINFGRGAACEQDSSLRKCQF